MKYVVGVTIVILLALVGGTLYKRYQAKDGLGNRESEVVSNNNWGGAGVTTGLHRAMQSKPLDEIKNMLRFGANPNARDEYGQTPMHYAAFYNRVDVLKMLIEHGGNPSIGDELGMKIWDMVNETPENEDMLDFLEFLQSQ